MSKTNLVADKSDKYEDKPLLKVFLRIIGNNSQQNTLLTNAQIIEILKKEFLINLSNVHDLEIDIYLNLVKKFLNDWPPWDEFDKKMERIAKQNNKIEQMELESYYVNLKEYLNQMLDTAKPQIENAVREVKETVGKDNPKVDGNVVLEVNCTREQLNKLFYRRPHPDRNNTIFNVEASPDKIQLYSKSLKSIFNWTNTCIIVNIGGILFNRQTTAVTNRKLINKKLNHWKEAPQELNMGIEVNNSNPQMPGKTHTLQLLFNVLDSASRIFPKEMCFIVMAIKELLTTDFTCSWDVNIPSQFRKTLNKYPYSRYLYSDVNTEIDESINLGPNGYDLQLEESIIPKININVMKSEIGPIKYNKKWLLVKCMECNMRFTDRSFKTHFDKFHQSEPNWKCTNCGEDFEMEKLCENSWNHSCHKHSQFFNSSN